MNFESFVEQLILEKLIKITGPAIVYKPKKVLVRGGIGTGHAMLWGKLAKGIARALQTSVEKAEDIMDRAKPEDIIEGFMTSENKFVTREQAWHIAREYKKVVKAMDDRGVTPELASEYL
jgi:hypothetical protein